MACGFKSHRPHGALSSAVERPPYTRKAIGSNPIAPTKSDIISYSAGVAQVVERFSEKEEVASASLASGTNCAGVVQQ